MYKEILQAIAGVEIFPVISLLLFVTVFGTVLFWTFRVDRTRLSEFSQMPLDDATLPHVPPAQSDAPVKGVAQ
jgi:cytochrome c oxidase cbb3-type subunit 4